MYPEMNQFGSSLTVNNNAHESSIQLQTPKVAIRLAHEIYIFVEKDMPSVRSLFK